MKTNAPVIQGDFSLLRWFVTRTDGVLVAMFVEEEEATEYASRYNEEKGLGKGLLVCWDRSLLNSTIERENPASKNLHANIMARIEKLMEDDPASTSRNGEELNRLAKWVEQYEKEVYDF